MKTLRSTLVLHRGNDGSGLPMETSGWILKVLLTSYTCDQTTARRVAVEVKSAATVEETGNRSLVG